MAATPSPKWRRTAPWELAAVRGFLALRQSAKTTCSQRRFEADPQGPSPEHVREDIQSKLGDLVGWIRKLLMGPSLALEVRELASSEESTAKKKE